MPTAFVASYGSGRPSIGILAEYDALPGTSQDAVPTRMERQGVDAGHACGHSIFGSAADVHQLDRVERAPAVVRRGGGVRRQAPEAELHGDVGLRVAVGRGGAIAGVPREDHVGVLEHPFAQHVRLADAGLLRRRPVEPDRAPDQPGLHRLPKALSDFKAVRDPLKYVTLIPDGQKAPKAIR